MLTFIKKILGTSTTDFHGSIKNRGVIIDIRTTAEYRTGHISGSKNYPLDIITDKVAELKKMKKPVITVCRSGARSGIAQGILRSAGIEVYNGGAWTSLKNTLSQPGLRMGRHLFHVAL